MNIGPLTLLVLQPTQFCNIDCSYCYLANRSIKGVMSDGVLTWALRRAFSSGLIRDEIDILWHAGEPLVAGLEFYRNASKKIATLNPGGLRVSQCLQTNGTLIDAEWCELFKSENIKVGVSLDGPEDIHDAHRRARNGSGTFRSIMRGIDRLRGAGVPFSVLAVLTRESLHQIDEVLDFFEQERFYNVAFNLEEIEGTNTEWSFATNEDVPALYARFAEQALSRHLRGTLAVREIASIERRLKQHPRTTIAPPNPLRFVTVGMTGEFSTYCPELHGVTYRDGTRHVFGNVLTDDFVDIVSNVRFLSLYHEIADGMAKCAANCDRFSICGSSRVGNKYYENGSFSSTETVQCRTRIKTIAAAIETLGTSALAAGADKMRTAPVTSRIEAQV